jgi:RNA polymerase sigma-70 factor, ECF subfamily
MKNSETTPHFWITYRTTLYRFILARVNDPVTAEDIVQDVLIKIYQHLDTVQDQEKLLSWMYQITRNAVIDYYRGQPRRQQLSADMERVAAVEKIIVEEDVEKELARCLWPMVKQLPATYQQAVQLAEFDGLTQKEVAQQQGLSLSGAKSRIQRGRKLLKRLLMDCCRLEFDRQGNLFNYEPVDNCDQC